MTHTRMRSSKTLVQQSARGFSCSFARRAGLAPGDQKQTRSMHMCRAQAPVKNARRHACGTAEQAPLAHHCCKLAWSKHCMRSGARQRPQITSFPHAFSRCDAPPPHIPPFSHMITPPQRLDDTSPQRHMHPLVGRAAHAYVPNMHAASRRSPLLFDSGQPRLATPRCATALARRPDLLLFVRSAAMSHGMRLPVVAPRAYSASRY